MPVILVYKFDLLIILQHFCMNSTFMNSASSEFCNISACTDGLWIPPLKNVEIFQPVMMVYKFHLLRIFQYSSSYSSLPTFVYQCHAHSWEVAFHTMYRGQRGTIICPLLVNFATLYFSLPLSQYRSLSISPPQLLSPLLLRHRRCPLQRPY